VTDAFDDGDVTFSFPGGERPFTSNDAFRFRGDLRAGSHVRFERIADDFVEIVVVDGGRDWRDGESFLCEAGAEGPGHLVFLRLPPLAS
jgi:hypothetical protein